jgi:hypothetical protein
MFDLGLWANDETMIQVRGDFTALILERRAQHDKYHRTSAPGLFINLSYLGHGSNDITRANRLNEVNINTAGQASFAELGQVVKDIIFKAKNSGESLGRGQWPAVVGGAGIPMDGIGVADRVTIGGNHFLGDLQAALAFKCAANQLWVEFYH